MCHFTPSNCTREFHDCRPHSDSFNVICALLLFFSLNSHAQVSIIHLRPLKITRIHGEIAIPVDVLFL